MTPFSAIITPQSVSFAGPDGRMHNVLSTDAIFSEVCAAVKVLQSAVRFEETNPGEENPHGSPDELHLALADLLEVKIKKINLAGEGLVSVIDGIVHYGEEAVHSAITERILWGLEEGFDMMPYIRFLENSMENPSKRAVDEMYSFMEKHQMGITDDGYILGYKRVKDNFFDIYSGKFDNSPGNIVEVRRNTVDDDANRTCSHGLHFCSMHYLPSYGTAQGNKIVIVKVHPKDIVSVPIDYNHAKVRTCRYEVLSEYTGSDKEDLLGTRAVWSDDDWRNHDFSGLDDDDDYCDECGCSSCECVVENDDDDNYCDECGGIDDACVCAVDDDQEPLVSEKTESSVRSSLDKLKKMQVTDVSVEETEDSITINFKVK